MVPAERLHVAQVRKQRSRRQVRELVAKGHSQFGNEFILRVQHSFVSAAGLADAEGEATEGAKLSVPKIEGLMRR